MELCEIYSARFPAAQARTFAVSPCPECNARREVRRESKRPSLLGCHVSHGPSSMSLDSLPGSGTTSATSQETKKRRRTRAHETTAENARLVGGRRRVPPLPRARTHAPRARPVMNLPQRINQLTDASIVGKPTADPNAEMQSAYAYLEALHRAPCNGNKSTVLWKRMPTNGVSNDLNTVIRSFAIAVSERRQLVLLPPTAASRAALPSRAAASSLDAVHPWHWLGNSLPLSTILHPSSCHERLLREYPNALDRIGANASDASKVAAGLGLPEFAGRRSKDHTMHNKWFIELSVSRHIPKPFRAQ